MTGPERKWQIDTWVFVAFVAVITAIGALFTLAHILKAAGWALYAFASFERSSRRTLKSPLVAQKGKAVMAMYKRILVAIDGSDTSELALREAQNAMLRLVHVVDVTPQAYMTTEITPPLAAQFPLADYRKALQEAGEKLLATRATTCVRLESISMQNWL
jgi:Universal stress protein family